MKSGNDEVKSLKGRGQKEKSEERDVHSNRTRL